MVLDDEKVVGIIAAEKGYVPTKRPWYLNAVEKGSTVWTQPYVDVNTKKLIVSCATPVFNNQKSIVGVIGFDVLLDTIQKDIISLDIGYNSQAFLLGKDGNFLAKPGVISTDSAWNMAVKADSALNSDNLEFRKIILDMIAGKSGVGTHMENGSTSIVSYAPLNAIDASVGIVISEKEVMKPARDIRQLIMGVWVAVVIVSIFIGLIIGNGITKPINELSMKADLISQGKSDLTEITTKRKDEIGLLIESYNRLIASLKIAMSRRQK
jgi:methyl-accepting chemotaxis protein